MNRCECGAEPQIVLDVTNRFHAVECPECGNTTGFCAVESDVVQRWNDGMFARFSNWVAGLA